MDEDVPRLFFFFFFCGPWCPLFSPPPRTISNRTWECKHDRASRIKDRKGCDWIEGGGGGRGGGMEMIGYDMSGRYDMIDAEWKAYRV